MTKNLSTILFIDDVPVGYAITRQDTRVEFTPTAFSAKACCPPHFVIVMENNDYQFDPLVDEKVKEQAIISLEQLKAGRLLD